MPPPIFVRSDFITAIYVHGLPPPLFDEQIELKTKSNQYTWVAMRIKRASYREPVVVEFPNHKIVSNEVQTNNIIAMNIKAIKNIVVKGDIILENADCAEEFDVISNEVDPGTVMVLNHDGILEPSNCAYDKRVAGVVSGAGAFRPGIILDKHKEVSGVNNRLPIALMGKVNCKVDADYSSVEIGDLLTASPTLGHAMKADDPYKAFGTVIGKALRPLEKGQSLIPVLVALQ